MQNPLELLMKVRKESEQKDIHNFIVNLKVSEIQENSQENWEKLIKVCKQYPNAYMVEVLPKSDKEIKADKFVDKKEDLDFLFYMGSSNAHLDVYECVHLPVVKIVADEQCIALSALDSFDDYSLKAMLSKSPEFFESYLTGSEFLSRFTSSESLAFYNNNPPSLYVEYIEDEYNEEWGWKSLDENFKVYSLFNPGSLGPRKLSFTPHY